MARTHDATTRTRAVLEARQLVTQGMSANQAAAKIAKPLGVTGRTIQSWATQAGMNLGDASHEAANRAREVQEAQYLARRAELRNQLLTKAQDLIERMDKPHIDFRGKDAGRVEFPIATSGDVRNYAVAVGVLIDKMRLEAGEPTQITGSSDLDTELRMLLAAADEQARRR